MALPLFEPSIGFSSLPVVMRTYGNKKSPSVLLRLFFSAEREGLIQCFAFHPDMVGAATLSRAVSMALPLFEPSCSGSHPSQKPKSNPPCWEDCFFTAEREGFEPSVRINAQRFSRPPDSTTLAPLLVVQQRRRLLHLSFCEDRRGI